MRTRGAGGDRRPPSFPSSPGRRRSTCRATARCRAAAPRAAPTQRGETRHNRPNSRTAGRARESTSSRFEQKASSPGGASLLRTSALPPRLEQKASSPVRRRCRPTRPPSPRDESCGPGEDAEHRRHPCIQHAVDRRPFIARPNPARRRCPPVLAQRNLQRIERHPAGRRRRRCGVRRPCLRAKCRRSSANFARSGRSETNFFKIRTLR